MRILYVSNDQGGCRHYRCMLPASKLAEAGHEVLVGGDILTRPSGEICGRHPEEYDKGVRGFDVVVLQRWMHEKAADKIRAARSTGQAVINDVDDWFFGVPTSNVGFAATHRNNNAERNVEHYRRELAASTAITVSTPYLAQRLEHLGRPTYVLRNAIDLHRWGRHDRPEGPPRIGWLGHTSYRAGGDLSTLGGVLGPFLERHPEWMFSHVGAVNIDGVIDETRAEATAAALGIPRERLEAMPGCTIPDLPAAYARFDVGLAPLEDCPFNRAKSWLKPLEYAAAGVPSIGSRLPEYAAFGSLEMAGNAREWSAAMERLVDPIERTALALSAGARARELSIDKMWPMWEAAYMAISSGALGESLLAPPPPKPPPPGLSGADMRRMGRRPRAR